MNFFGDLVSLESLDNICTHTLTFHIALYCHDKIYTIQQCFGAVIDAWAKADDRYKSAEHAESLLYRMEELFLDKKSNNPRENLTAIAYNLGKSYCICWLMISRKRFEFFSIICIIQRIGL